MFINHLLVELQPLHLRRQHVQGVRLHSDTSSDISSFSFAEFSWSHKGELNTRSFRSSQTASHR